ncbi:immediate early response gene 2 protein [Hirundo rustica]|uniref:immediate early response gene 2 protein n=1 Tax=Hirundo rustica TaxID=43150 RepID=UPI001A94CC49|nr:immediate early response gene 2 protein [Hirundo rustica]
MEEAQRLLTVSVWKLYRCRLRRGGLRLHRSLQLSLLVRAARHRYLSARAAAESLPGAACGQSPQREPGRDPRAARCPDPAEPAAGSRREWASPRKECTGDRPNLPTGAPAKKRRSGGSAGPGPGPVPSKRARLEAEAPPLPPGRCSGPPAAAFGFVLRAVGAC